MIDRNNWITYVFGDDHDHLPRFLKKLLEMIEKVSFKNSNEIIAQAIVQEIVFHVIYSWIKQNLIKNDVICLNNSSWSNYIPNEGHSHGFMISLTSTLTIYQMKI